MLFQFDTPLNRLLETAIVQRAAGKLVEAIVTGNPAVFDANVAQPLARMLVPFTPVQAGSGDASPDNVRAISGWTGVNAFHGGTNFLPIPSTLAEGWTNTVSGVTATFADGYFDVTGTSDPESGNWANVVSFNTAFSANPIILPPGTYVMPQNLTVAIRVGGTTQNKSASFTLTEEAQIYGFYIAVYKGTETGWRIPLVLTTGTTRPTEYTEYHEIESYPVVFPAMGKNLLPPSVFYYYQSSYLAVSGDTITVKKSDDRAWTALNGLFLKAGKYVITRSNAQGNLTIRTSINDYASNLLQTQNASASFTLSEDCTIKIKFSGSSATYPYDTTVMIEAGETATAFEPYTNTVYGGELDLVTGVLTVTHIFSKTTWGTAAKSGSDPETGLQSAYIDFPVNVKQCTSQDKYGVSTLCNICNKIIWGNASYTPMHYYINNSNRVWMAFPADMDEDTEIQFIAELKTPITVQLDPVTIQTLIGENTLWTDTNGTNEITYMQKG